MISTRVAANYLQEFDHLEADSSMEDSRKLSLMRCLLENMIDVVKEPIQSHFSKQDDILIHLNCGNHSPVRLVDSLLRSTNIFLVAKLVD
jgi:hypothetical protein